MMDAKRTRASILISPTKSPSKTGGKSKMGGGDSSVVQGINDAWDKLNELWDVVSLDSSARELRTRAAHEHFKALIDDILISEREMVDGVKSDIKSSLEMDNAIRKELGEPPFKEDAFKKNSVNLLKNLRKDLDRLKTQKSEMMKAQLNYYDELSSICERLDEEVPNFEGVEDKILPKDVVKEICAIKDEKKRTLDERIAQLIDLQERANRMNSVVKNVTLDEFERDLLHLNFANKGMPASEKYVDRFERLLQKFDDEYRKWLEQMEFQYTELYTQIAELSNKCYAMNVVESFSPDFDPSEHTDVDLNRMKQSLAKLQQRYEEGVEVFDKFAEWNEAYQKVEDLAQLMQTDAYRKNRGGCLNRALKEEKANKTAMNERLEELKLLCDRFPQITFDGSTPYEVAMDRLNYKEIEKENEKMIKKQTRQEQLKLEQRYGTAYTSKVASPSKRTPQASTTIRPASSAQHRLRTPQTNALNRKRLQTPHTEGLIKRRRSSSLSCIEPALEGHFVTSSPKFDLRSTPQNMGTPRRIAPPKSYKR